MKTTVWYLSLILLSTGFWSCEKETVRIVPNNQTSSQTHQISNIERLEIGDPFEVFIDFSATEERLRIEANDNLHTMIRVRQNGDQLSIDVKDQVDFTHGNVTLKIYLTAKSLYRIAGSGTTAIYLQDNWETNLANIDLTGASSLEGTVYADRIDAEIVGASTVKISGATDKLDIDATGASRYEGFDCTSRKLSVELEGGCEVSATVSEELEVDASGASTVYYKGNGVIKEQKLSGGSQIIKVE